MSATGISAGSGLSADLRAKLQAAGLAEEFDIEIDRDALRSVPTTPQKWEGDQPEAPVRWTKEPIAQISAERDYKSAVLRRDKHKTATKNLNVSAWGYGMPGYSAPYASEGWVQALNQVKKSEGMGAGGIRFKVTQGNTAPVFVRFDTLDDARKAAHFATQLGASRNILAVLRDGGLTASSDAKVYLTGLTSGSGEKYTVSRGSSPLKKAQSVWLEPRHPDLIGFIDGSEYHSLAAAGRMILRG